MSVTPAIQYLAIPRWRPTFPPANCRDYRRPPHNGFVNPGKSPIHYSRPIEPAMLLPSRNSPIKC